MFLDVDCSYGTGLPTPRDASADAALPGDDNEPSGLEGLPYAAFMEQHWGAVREVASRGVPGSRALKAVAAMEERLAAAPPLRGRRQVSEWVLGVVRVYEARVEGLEDLLLRGGVVEYRTAALQREANAARAVAQAKEASVRGMQQHVMQLQTALAAHGGEAGGTGPTHHLKPAEVRERLAMKEDLLEAQRTVAALRGEVERRTATAKGLQEDLAKAQSALQRQREASLREADLREQAEARRRAAEERAAAAEAQVEAEAENVRSQAGRKRAAHAASVGGMEGELRASEQELARVGALNAQAQRDKQSLLKSLDDMSKQVRKAKAAASAAAAKAAAAESAAARAAKAATPAEAAEAVAAAAAVVPADNGGGVEEDDEEDSKPAVSVAVMQLGCLLREARAVVAALCPEGAAEAAEPAQPGEEEDDEGGGVGGPESEEWGMVDEARGLASMLRSLQSEVDESRREQAEQRSRVAELEAKLQSATEKPPSSRKKRRQRPSAAAVAGDEADAASSHTASEAEEESEEDEGSKKQRKEDARRRMRLVVKEGVKKEPAPKAKVSPAFLSLLRRMEQRDSTRKERWGQKKQQLVEEAKQKALLAQQNIQEGEEGNLSPQAGIGVTAEADPALQYAAAAEAAAAEAAAAAAAVSKPPSRNLKSVASSFRAVARMEAVQQQVNRDNTVLPAIGGLEGATPAHALSGGGGGGGGGAAGPRNDSVGHAIGRLKARGSLSRGRLEGLPTQEPGTPRSRLFSAVKLVQEQEQTDGATLEQHHEVLCLMGGAAPVPSGLRAGGVGVGSGGPRGGQGPRGALDEHLGVSGGRGGGGASGARRPEVRAHRGIGRMPRSLLRMTNAVGRVGRPQTRDAPSLEASGWT